MRRILAAIGHTAAPTRYDLVLAAIPSVFVLAVLAGHVLSVSPDLAVAGASLLGSLAVLDAMFLNPPRPET